MNPAEPVKRIKTKSIRRVGTFTMGLSLIATGLLSIYSLINPSFDILIAIKFSPAILILLGIEILVAYFVGSGEKIKYDFLSGFVCLILIGAGIGFAVLPLAIDYYGPPRNILESKLSSEVYNRCYEQLKGDADISTLNIYVSLRGYGYQSDLTADQLSSAEYIHASVTFLNAFDSKADFAAKCREVTEKILAPGFDFDDINFYYENDVQSYQLNLSGSFQNNMKAADLEKLVVYELPGEEIPG
ncbi:hypothetical protein SDC9_168271 [bioreactor metagenome]|uniref:Uncharacterized protein n=1 Tax=bioreactor metagenome TaxID=1076179 RepID=A0A645G4L0_9ZZZZ